MGDESRDLRNRAAGAACFSRHHRAERTAACGGVAAVLLMPRGGRGGGPPRWLLRIGHDNSVGAMTAGVGGTIVPWNENPTGRTGRYRVGRLILWIRVSSGQLLLSEPGQLFSHVGRPRPGVRYSVRAASTLPHTACSVHEKVQCSLATNTLCTRKKMARRNPQSSQHRAKQNTNRRQHNPGHERSEPKTSPGRPH